MKRIVVSSVLGAMCLLAARRAEASCEAMEPKTIELTVVECTPVDLRTVKSRNPALKDYDWERYAGVMVKGQVDGRDVKLWVPAREETKCDALTAKSVVSGSQGRACCDGDPNPPCYLDTSLVLSKVAVKRPSASAAAATATASGPVTPVGVSEAQPAPSSRGCGCETSSSSSSMPSFSFASLLGGITIGLLRRRTRGRIARTCELPS